MRCFLLLLMFGFSAALAAPAAQNAEPDNPKNVYPKDVARFIKARDLCDHLRQEEPYDEERRLYLKISIEKQCTGMDARLARLKKKYRKQPDISAALSAYEPKIEPLQAQPAEVASPAIDTPPVVDPDTGETLPLPTEPGYPYEPPAPETEYR